MADRTGDPIDRQYRAYIENMYSPIPKDDLERTIDNIFTLIEMGHDKRQSLPATLEFAAKTIFKLFKFQEIGVGLKDRKDGKYRYEVLFGFRREVADNFRKMEYDLEDMVSREKFPFIKTGKYSELDPVEGLPEEEKFLFNRPLQLEAKRKSAEEFLEGDYFDVWMYSQNKEIIGWFELAGTIDDKIPSRTNLRWIELIAGICSLIVLERWTEEDSRRVEHQPYVAPPRPNLPAKLN